MIDGPTDGKNRSILYSRFFEKATQKQTGGGNDRVVQMRLAITKSVKGARAHTFLLESTYLKI